MNYVVGLCSTEDYPRRGDQLFVRARTRNLVQRGGLGHATTGGGCLDEGKKKKPGEASSCAVEKKKCKREGP